MKSYKVELPKGLFQFLGILVIILGIFIFIVSLLTKESLGLCFGLLGIISGMGIVLYKIPQLWKIYVSKEGLQKKCLWKKLAIQNKDLMAEWNYKNNYLIVNPDTILPTYSENV